MPNPDSPPIFDRLLDARHGGSFQLSPAEPFEAVRRYRPGTNVLETTFTTASAAVRVSDAMTIGEASQRLLVRLVDGLHGNVLMGRHFEPRDARAALGGEDSAPLSREQIERDVERTSALCMHWAGRATYEGPWHEAVVRSALELLTFAPSGAIVAAPTTSLPERLGGDHNWDYRYSWLRDGIYTMRALLALGYIEEAEAFFRWQMRATEQNAPEVSPLYRIDGNRSLPEESSTCPATAVLGRLARATPLRRSFSSTTTATCSRAPPGCVHKSSLSARMRVGGWPGFADFVGEAWRRPDAGIREVRDEPYDFVQ